MKKFIFVSSSTCLQGSTQSDYYQPLVLVPSVSQLVISYRGAKLTLTGVPDILAVFIFLLVGWLYNDALVNYGS